MKTYKLNNIEVSEEQLRQVIKDNPEILDTLEPNETKSKFFEPQEGEFAYFLADDGIGFSRDWNMNIELDRRVIARGVYRTKEEAEKADQKRMALVRLWNWADKNAPFTPDWKDDRQDKCYVDSYGYLSNKFNSDFHTIYQSNFTLPYFKNLDDVSRFIEECDADLRIYCL